MKQSQRTQIAKITRPVLAQVYPRQRLFRWLDRARRQYPVLWIQAPPGAGKTTLIASYLAAREPSTLWYQIDEGDGDVASFFYYLGLASHHAARRRRALTLLTPEYLRGLPTFTRNFFREFFARLERPGVLVLDNYQDVSPTAPIHELLPVGLSEIPAGVNVVILSRVAPPAGFARFRASNHLAVLPWDDLRLTPQEGARIAALFQGSKYQSSRAALSPHTLRALHEKSDGWVAGLVLLLQEESESRAAADAPQRNLQTLFDYFAEEVFLKTDAVTQSVLMKSSVMPKMSVALVEKLTEVAHAGSILHDLNQKNYFTYRLRTTEPVYEYHPLFREFLRARARETFPPHEMQQITGRVARLQESVGDHESAVSFYAEAQDWAEAARLILAQAQGLIAEGRHQTLAQWIQLLPESLTSTHPWLLFWRGVTIQATDLLAARACYTDAYRGFCSQDVPLGAFMAWSAIENTFHYFLSDFAPLTSWIEELQTLRTRYPEYPSLAIEASVTAAMFGALMWSAPSHADISWWAERVEAMLAENDAAVAPRVQGGNYLIVYYVWWRGDLAAAARVLDMVKPLVASRELTPLLKLTWYTMQGHYLAASGQRQDCLRMVDEGFQLAEQTGVHVVDHQLCVAGVHGSLFAGDLASAEAYLQRSAAGLRPGAFFDAAHYHHLATWLALAQGDIASARSHGETASKYATLCGAENALAVARLSLAHVQAETGDHEAALDNLAEVLRWTTKAGSKNMRFHSFLSRAHVLLNMRDEAGALAALQEGLAIGRAEGYVAHAWWIGFCRDVMARLCMKALEASIEVPYVQTLIRHLHLSPERPPWHIETWPWPIRVHTLGRFVILKEDAPLAFTGKTQKKPLELLRALIALDGQGVNTSELAEILWPDADGDMAAHAFETTLYRLRKLLGEEGCLTLQGSLLSLNPTYCWLDVWAFEQALDRAEIQRALSLYRGPFLGKDDAPWALPLRDRLRSKFLRAVLQQGRASAESAQWEAAIDCYLKGLETDPLAEELYRHLMLAYKKLNRFAEALAVYRRCQTALTSILGAEPAPQTQALFREIRTAWQ